MLKFHGRGRRRRFGDSFFAAKVGSRFQNMVLQSSRVSQKTRQLVSNVFDNESQSVPHRSAITSLLSCTYDQVFITRTSTSVHLHSVFVISIFHMMWAQQCPQSFVSLYPKSGTSVWTNNKGSHFIEQSGDIVSSEDGQVRVGFRSSAATLA